MEEGILLEWSSSSSSGFGSFNVHRGTAAAEGRYVLLNAEPIEGEGMDVGAYSYLDRDVIPGTLYYYKLEAIGLGGVGGMFFGPFEVMAEWRELEYSLDQNVPNPFSRATGTRIGYSVARSGMVELRIMDVAGRLVRRIQMDAKPGESRMVWDGRDESGRFVSSGVYFYEMRGDGFSAQRKMLLAD